jgi:hypothetical protein
MYQILKNCIKDLDNSLIIPIDERNRHYQEYLAWVAEGNEPIPLDEEFYNRADKEVQIENLYKTKIEAIMPENMINFALARSIELVSKGLDLTPQEKAEKDHINSVWGRVKALREHKQSLAAQLAKSTDLDVEANWPE